MLGIPLIFTNIKVLFVYWQVYLEAYATNETLEYKDVKEDLQKECESFEHESQTDCHEQEKELVTIMQGKYIFCIF